MNSHPECRARSTEVACATGVVSSARASEAASPVFPGQINLIVFGVCTESTRAGARNHVQRNVRERQ